MSIKFLQLRNRICFILILINLIFYSCTHIEEINENQIDKRVEFYENGVLKEVKNYDKQNRIIENIGYDITRNIIWRSIYKYNKKGEKIKSINFQKGNIFSGETEFIYNEGKDMGYISSNSEGAKLRFVNTYNYDNLIASYEITPENKFVKYTTYVYDSANRRIEENENAISYSDLESNFPRIQTELWTSKKIFRDSIGQVLNTISLEFHGENHPFTEIHSAYDKNENIIEHWVYSMQGYDSVKGVFNRRLKLIDHSIFLYTNDELFKKIDLLKNDSVLYSKKEKNFSLK